MLEAAIEEAVRHIRSSELNRRAVAGRLCALKGKDVAGTEGLLEDRLVKPIKRRELSARVAGVDSGFVGRGFGSVDITLVRVAGVIMGYKGGKLQDTEYWPAIFGFPKPYISKNALEVDEYSCSRSLLRLREEVRTAREIIEKFGPDYCLLDGSIVPQYADKPRKDSKVCGMYNEMLVEFQRLYEAADANSCRLVACVEDSRGSRLRSILQEGVLRSMPVVGCAELDDMLDSALFDSILGVGERSSVFSYSKNTEEHPVLMDFGGKWGSKIHALYMKPAELDRPLRVEFICNNNFGKTADEIASTIYALSCMHREYAFPSVLIEADLRARLRPAEIAVVYNRIMDKLGNGMKLRLRREGRPF